MNFILSYKKKVNDIKLPQFNNYDIHKLIIIIKEFCLIKNNYKVKYMINE